jgi:hypothetical protein
MTTAADHAQSPTAQTLNQPMSVEVDGNGGLYVADMGNNRVLHFP